MSIQQISRSADPFLTSLQLLFVDRIGIRVLRVMIRLSHKHKEEPRLSSIRVRLHASLCISPSLRLSLSGSELQERYPSIPIISEAKVADYFDRKEYIAYFCVSPLDGYKVRNPDPHSLTPLPLGPGICSTKWSIQCQHRSLSSFFPCPWCCLCSMQKFLFQR
jgi:hypothetical protein